MMTPWQQLENVYNEGRQADPDKFPLTFEQMFALHAKAHFAFSTPQFIIYGRPVIKGTDRAHVTDPCFSYPHELADCWFLHGMAGDMGQVWSILPWELPWIAWERVKDSESELFYVKTSVLKRLCPPKGNPYV